MLHSMWISPPGEPSCRSCLALQNDRSAVILSEAKDPGRRTGSSVGTREDSVHRTAFCRSTSSYIRDSSALRPQNDKACVILSEAIPLRGTRGSRP